MTRGEVRRRLAVQWWRQLLLSLAPLLAMSLIFGGESSLLAILEMPLFIGALASLFVTLPLFSGYKRALIATERSLDTDAEHDAWLALARQRSKGLLAAGLPAWIGALAVLAGLNAVALTLLALASVVLLWLYRLPSQLG